MTTLGRERNVSLQIPERSSEWIADFIFLISPPSNKPVINVNISNIYDINNENNQNNNFTLDDETGIDNFEDYMTKQIQLIFKNNYKSDNFCQMYFTISLLIFGLIWLIGGAIYSFAIINFNKNKTPFIVWIIVLIVILGMIMYCLENGNSQVNRFTTIVSNVKYELNRKYDKITNNGCIYFVYDNINVEYLDENCKYNDENIIANDDYTNTKRKYAIVRVLKE